MGTVETYELRPIGWVRSPLTDRGAAPKQGDEGAPPARIVVRPEVAEAMADLTVGATVIVLTWLHEGDRSVLAVHPRDDVTRPRTGVFSTRSQDRPNPVGLHVVRIAGIDGTTLDVQDLEAIDGTPVLDIKPYMTEFAPRGEIRQPAWSHELMAGYWVSS
jgi:tRNA-Thr(GGU) m(6)t(6)A37 methyltransferase TsaA